MKRTVAAIVLLVVAGLWPLVVFKLDGGVTATPRATIPAVVTPSAPSLPGMVRPERASRSVEGSKSPRQPVVNGLAEPRSTRPASPTVLPARRPSGAPTPRLIPPVSYDNLGVRDITEYCWTGNHNAAGRWPQIGDVAVLDRSIPFGTRISIQGLGNFVVRDWVGHGSEFDLYEGRDSGCETRARNFGRQHRKVTVLR